MKGLCVISVFGDNVQRQSILGGDIVDKIIVRNDIRGIMGTIPYYSEKA